MKALPAVALAIAVVAVLRSPKKLHTAMFIVGVELICAILAATVGLAIGTQASAGTAAGVVMQVGGIAASLERIWRYRNPDSGGAGG